MDLWEMIGQAQTLVIGDMDCFSFREPKGKSCAIVVESSDLILEQFQS